MAAQNLTYAGAARELVIALLKERAARSLAFEIPDLERTQRENGTDAVPLAAVGSPPPSEVIDSTVMDRVVFLGASLSLLAGAASARDRSTRGARGYGPRAYSLELELPTVET